MKYFLAIFLIATPALASQNGYWEARKFRHMCFNEQTRQEAKCSTLCLDRSDNLWKECSAVRLNPMEKKQ